jgi:CheY-like chemotaxis protein
MNDLQELPRRSVLCVDANGDAMAALRELLVNYDVICVENAREALRETNARAFDIYVLEYFLPDWTGPELCRAIREVDPHAPIVFCTTGDDRLRERALRAGANAYVSKPIEPVHFLAQLKRLLACHDAASLSAKVAEEAAIQHELERRVAFLRQRVVAANQMSAGAFERITRVKAYKAFLDGRGTRAHFERWWPQVFQSAEANHEG